MTRGTRNRPLSHKGYYYDIETGFYYVSSRYYDPEICRWINADIFASTGQGILGCNMFAYCGNEPIDRSDPTGEFWWIIPVVVIALCLSGCSDDSSPPDYLYNDDRSGACYEYVGTYIGIDYSSAGDTDPGTYYARRTGLYKSQLPRTFTISELSKQVRLDFDTLGISYKLYDNYVDIPKLAEDELLIACMQCYTKKGVCDYHFAVRLSNGEWADKPSTSHSRHGILSYNDQTWVDAEGRINSATEDTTCFFVVKIG